MTTTTQQVQQYYQDLLIFQYLGKPKAYATIGALANIALEADANVQFISFSGTPASGTFTLSYGGLTTSAIAWNAIASTIQTDLNAILTAPLVSAVTGSIASGLTITFSGYTSAIGTVSVTSSLLDAGSNALLAAVSPIGDQLPTEIQNGFNLSGTPAVGAQLDILGKYVGVIRSGYGFFNPITLDDTDFLKLIQMAIVRNSAGSSLATIQSFLNQFFAGDIFVFDYANMNMSYLISTSIGSQDLIDLFVTEGLLPKPMGVGLSVIAAPVIDMFFAFRTYSAAASSNTTPFNSYGSYQTSWLFISYAYAIHVSVQ